MKIEEARGEHWFHKDSRGLFYYKNHEEYLKDIRTYLQVCMSCSKYIYPNEPIRIVTGVSRVGSTISHLSCNNE